MKWYLRWFCHLVIQLDRFPRYGRLYRGVRRPEGGWDFKGPEWVWQRRGRWGLHLLDRMGLLWRYIDTIMGPYEPYTEKEEDDATT